MTEKEVRRIAIEFMEELDKDPERAREYDAFTIEEIFEMIRRGEIKSSSDKYDEQLE